MHPDDTPDKAELRRALLARRARLSPPELRRARDDVRVAVLRRCRDLRWRSVAAYVPLRTEPGSTQLLDALCAAGVAVIVPVLLPDRDLDWRRWEPGAPADAATADAALGRDAIRDVDAVLAPALAVDRAGTRLGRGGGSYDRALARVRPGVPVAAVLHEGELVDALPSDPWDVPVAAVVTPGGWCDLRPPRVDGE